MTKYAWVTDSQNDFFCDKICRAGDNTDETLKKVLSGELVIDLKSGLIGGMFRSFEQQVGMWRERLPRIADEFADHGADLEQLQSGLDELATTESKWPTQGYLPAGVIVLDPPRNETGSGDERRDDAWLAGQLYWSWMCDRHEASWKHPNLVFDRKRICYHEGCGNLTNEWRWRWACVDLNASKGVSVRIARERNLDQSLPGIELLAAGCVHEWVKNMDGKTVWFSFLPGFDVRYADDSAWSDVARLDLDRGNSKVNFSLNDSFHTDSRWCVPVFCEGD